MDNHLKNFRAWYIKILEDLCPKRDAGIAILMISLPLLERYLRQKNSLRPENPLNDGCMDTLRSVFPALPDRATAWTFWQVYRNGFLHQATLSMSTRKGAALPAASLTHDMTSPVAIEADGSFVLHPCLFSQHVLRAIEAEFAIFAGTGTPTPQMPTVVATVNPTGVTVLNTKGS